MIFFIGSKVNNIFLNKNLEVSEKFVYLWSFIMRFKLNKNTGEIHK